MEEKRKIDWPQWAVASATFLLALGTFWIIKQNYDLKYLEWRPELYLEHSYQIIDKEAAAEQVQIIKKAEEGNLKDLGLQLTVSWGNSGGSPALHVSRHTSVNRIKGPLADTMKYDTGVAIAVWPNQKYPDELAFNIGNHAPDDMLYLHVSTWYYDREGNKYWIEPVYFIKFVNNKMEMYGMDDVYEDVFIK
jgi:hypothetical protein